MNLKLRPIVPIVLLNNERKHDVKKFQIKNKGVRSLKQLKSVRQSMGKSNRIKEQLVSPEAFVSRFMLTAPAVVNAILPKIRNKAQAENRNYDFKYKEKSKKEISRLRKLKYQARYANFDVELKPSKSKILQELEEDYKFVADLIIDFFEADIERENELAQLNLAKWVENLKLKEQKDYGYSKNYPYDPSYDPSWEDDDLDCYSESYENNNHEPFPEIDMIYRFEDCEDFRQCKYFPRCDKFCPKEIVSTIVDKSQQTEKTNVIDDTEGLDALYDKTHNTRMIINVFNNQRNNGR